MMGKHCGQFRRINELLFPTLTIWAILTVVGWADVDSGPPVGEATPKLEVQAVTGTVTDKGVDYAAERGQKPTVYVLVDKAKFSRPIGRFLKQLDTKLGETAEAEVVVVWLTPTGDETKEYLPKVQQSLQFQRTNLTYIAGENAAPAAWCVNSDADATVVVSQGGKTVARHGFVSVNDTLVPEVLKPLAK